MALLGMSHLLKEGPLARPGFSLLWLHLWGRLRVDPGDKAQAFLEHSKRPVQLSATAFKVQFSSVPQSCLTLCNHMDCSTPGLPVHHQLPELAQTHVHQVDVAIQPSVIPFSSCLPSFPASGSFPISEFFTSGGQSIGVSASASVFPVNIQDWFPLWWTGWISLQSKGL